MRTVRARAMRTGATYRTYKIAQLNKYERSEGIRRCIIVSLLVGCELRTQVLLNLAIY